jgi:tRNA(adenine34) deaminase
MSENEIDQFMELAIKEAKKAFDHGEVPIGAVVVKNGEVIAKGHNKREKSMNAICHAEILAITKACKKLGNWRLSDCDIFVTVEPCMMCMGALYNARIRGLYYGCENRSNGEFQIDKSKPIQNHYLETTGGIKESECRELMSKFFRK